MWKWCRLTVIARVGALKRPELLLLCILTTCSDRASASVSTDLWRYINVLLLLLLLEVVVDTYMALCLAKRPPGSPERIGVLSCGVHWTVGEHKHILCDVSTFTILWAMPTKKRKMAAVKSDVNGMTWFQRDITKLQTNSIIFEIQRWD